MKLSDALIEKRLGLRFFARDLELHATRAGHERGGLPRTFVERLAVERMTGGGRIGRAGILIRLVIGEPSPAAQARANDDEQSDEAMWAGVIHAYIYTRSSEAKQFRKHLSDDV